MILKKTYSQYIQYIKYMLGAVPSNEDSLEFMNDDLTEYIKIAFSEIEPYINVRKRLTIPWNQGSGGAIDFKLLNIRAKSVTAVRRGSEQGYLNTSYVSSIGTYYMGWYLPTGGRFSADYDPWSMQALMLKGINEISGDKHFLFDYEKQYLFIAFNMQYPKSVTIDYIPEYNSVEEIEDSYWQNIIQQYSLALVKIALSHLRGKYAQLAGSAFTLDYQRMINEGKEEREKILNDLMDNNLLNYRFD